jgi:amino acid transporter
MQRHDDVNSSAADDVKTLHHFGYAQELARRLGWFSNYAISLSIICILAGGITSFHVGFCSVGGASIGIGWPLCCLFSLCVAATMGQIASAFPTAGGLYHWASLLGGRGWGWATAWFNLAGLVTVLAAINVGTFQFAAGALAALGGVELPEDKTWSYFCLQFAAVLGITVSQAFVNHRGIRVTSRLTDFSGYWILFVAVALTVAALACADTWDLSRLWTFTNYSGDNGGNVWENTDNIAWLFALGLLLPAYTLTGFDASAHVSEETVGAAHNVPRGIVRSVLVSGIFGWLMLAAVVLAIPNMDEAAKKGGGAFHHVLATAFPTWLGMTLAAGIAIAHYLCGLATVTSASRMAFAFARDGGLPGHNLWRQVSHRYRTPAAAIWLVAAAAVLFTAYSRVYETITVVCVILLYISYVLPTVLGLRAYGRTWTALGPWNLGPWFRVLAVPSILGCGLLIALGMAPPNQLAAWTVGGLMLVLVAVWFAYARRHFPGPPVVAIGTQDDGKSVPT